MRKHATATPRSPKSSHDHIYIDGGSLICRCKSWRGFGCRQGGGGIRGESGYLLRAQRVGARASQYRDPSEVIRTHFSSQRGNPYIYIYDRNQTYTYPTEPQVWPRHYIRYGQSCCGSATLRHESTMCSAVSLCWSLSGGASEASNSVMMIHTQQFVPHFDRGDMVTGSSHALQLAPTPGYDPTTFRPLHGAASTLRYRPDLPDVGSPDSHQAIGQQAAELSISHACCGHHAGVALGELHGQLVCSRCGVPCFVDYRSPWPRPSFDLPPNQWQHPASDRDDHSPAQQIQP